METKNFGHNASFKDLSRLANSRSTLREKFTKEICCVLKCPPVKKQKSIHFQNKFTKNGKRFLILFGFC